MLYKIMVENFFSIADRQEIVLAIPGNAPDLLCFRTSSSDENVRLPVAVGFFGANASGKSTVLRAVVSAVVFFCKSFDWTLEQQMSEFFQAYRQKDWWDQPTKIMIEFDAKLGENIPPTIFRYELHIANNPEGFFNKYVLYEALSYAPKGKFRCLFERKEQTFRFGREFIVMSSSDSRQESIRPNASVISTLTKLNHQLSAYLSRSIGSLDTNLINYNQLNNNQWLAAYMYNKACLDSLNKELRRLDVGLESMVVEQGNLGLFAKLQHVGLDSFLFLEEESKGTQSFIKVFLRLHYALQTGNIVIIDEIDADLHPLLLPELFRWFNDPERNLHGAQLLFTAHNPTLLDDLEKEQVFFTEKLYGKSTQVYGAREIKGLRRDLSLVKKYLSGELGAVPHVG